MQFIIIRDNVHSHFSLWGIGWAGQVELLGFDCVGFHLTEDEHLQTRKTIKIIGKH